MNLTPGQTVIWFRRTLGTYGLDVVEGRNVTITEVQVVRIGPKLVQVASPPHGRLTWVNPLSLRRTDDPAVLRALNDRKWRRKG
jgi:hypothetical protein